MDRLPQVVPSYLLLGRHGNMSNKLLLSVLPSLLLAALLIRLQKEAPTA